MVAPNSIDASKPDGDDPMGPPRECCEVHCIHCGGVYMSDEIRWKPDPEGPDGGC